MDLFLTEPTLLMTVMSCPSCNVIDPGEKLSSWIPSEKLLVTMTATEQQEHSHLLNVNSGLGTMLNMILFSPEGGAIITQLLQKRMLWLRKTKQGRPCS